MSDSSTVTTLLDMFGARLSGELAFSLSLHGSVRADHPLANEIAATLNGKVASLPYPRRQDVVWVTLAPTAGELRRAIEDLRCWVLPSFGWESAPSILSEGGTAGQMGSLLLRQSPQGYFRWHSRLADIHHVIARLATMRAVIAQAPARQSQLRPSLEMLRRQFTLGLATGDRNTALQAINDIDQRQLDTASNALSMRIRLAAAFGDDQAIVNHPQLDDLLSMRIPQRVVESVLLAHHAVFLADHEAAGNIEAALAAYLPLYGRLAGLAGHPTDGADAAIVRMATYDAALAKDAGRLHALADRFPGDAVVAALASILPALGLQSSSEPAAPPVLKTEAQLVEPPFVETVEPPVTEGETHKVASVPVTDEPALPLDWSDVPTLVATDAHEPLAAFLQRAMLMPDACDPGDGDFVIELFTDSDIIADTKKRAAADQVLTTVIDAYVCEERFPRRERLSLYQAVLEIWSSSRTMSTDPIDGQLLLTIADALLRLDGRLEAIAATAIVRWWEARPVRSRLAWLGEALELLTEQSTAQDYLALWYAGAGLTKVDHEGFSVADRHLWYRLGRRLGLDVTTTDEALGGDWQPLQSADDPLLAAGFKKIAIVSLHERAAREAAAQIEDRTQAHVVLVTDHAAGEGTASATTADVILFVWGATKHAVYRAFDKVRDRLEYVQGTGSASIVRALERRVRAAGM
ncbi:hypothetical protein [Mesorhizobium sp. WSM2239]|uniref:Uncharacterized protein n=2 Tax=unclassified Mesorhizobium TaxID=325217 RepID=A0AAU8DH19_9HYPH